jgi:SAM-dependent methyltransferase
MATGVATYYDRLLRWNRVARIFGYGGGADTLTVHRALADPRAGGRPTFTRLHDILLERLGSRRELRVLDAGCGLGGTMIALAEALDATCTGVTISRTQAEAANAAAAARGVAARVRALVGSYDRPPAGPFDVVIAIESLAHSVDPAVSIKALSAVLAPGGCCLIVDDLPEPAASATAALEMFKTGWNCPVLWSRDEYVGAFAREGLMLVDEIDLTRECRPRPEWRVMLLMVLNRVCSRIAPAGIRQVLQSHRGGLALERLLRRRQVRYRMLVAKRPELRVS